MPKQFEFEGQQYELPDDTSDDEALEFISQQTQGAAPPSEIPPPPAEKPFGYKLKNIYFPATMDTLRSVGQLPLYAASHLLGEEKGKRIRQAADEHGSIGKAYLKEGAGAALAPALGPLGIAGESLKAASSLIPGGRPYAEAAVNPYEAAILEAGTDPTNLAFGALAKLGVASRAAETLVGAIFTGHGLHELGPAAQQAKQLYDSEGLTPRTIEAINDAVVSLGMVAGGAAGTVHGIKGIREGMAQPPKPQELDASGEPLNVFEEAELDFSPQEKRAREKESQQFSERARAEEEAALRERVELVDRIEREQAKEAQQIEKARQKAERLAAKKAEQEAQSGLADDVIRVSEEEISGQPVGGRPPISSGEEGPSAVQGRPPLPPEEQLGPPQQREAVLPEQSAADESGIPPPPQEFKVQGQEAASSGLEAKPANIGRRTSLSGGQEAAATAVVQEFAQEGRIPSEAEIIQRLQMGDLPVQLRSGSPSATRLYKVAAEVKRRLTERFGTVEPPPSEIPAPPKMEQSPASLLDHDLAQEGPAANPSRVLTPEEEFMQGKDWNVAEAGSAEELQAAMKRNLAPLEEGQTTPLTHDRGPAISPEGYSEVKERTTSPHYQKAADMANQIAQVWEQEMGTAGGQKFRTVFELGQGDRPLRGLTSREGRGWGSDPFTVAKDAYQRWKEQGQKAPLSKYMATEMIANLFHENLHNMNLGDMGLAHTHRAESKIGRKAAVEKLIEAGYSKDEAAKLVAAEGTKLDSSAVAGEKLTQAEGFKMMEALFEKVTKGTFNNLMESLSKNISDEDVVALANDHFELSKSDKVIPPSESGRSLPEFAPLAEQEHYTKEASREVAQKAKEQPGLLTRGGNLAWDLYVSSLAGGLQTVWNNLHAVGGLAVMHPLIEAVEVGRNAALGRSELAKKYGSRLGARMSLLTSGELMQTLADSFKVAATGSERNVSLSRSGKDVQKLEDFGRKHLPQLTEQTFGQFSSDVKIEGLHGIPKMMMAASILSERAARVSQIKIEMTPLMKEVGVSDYGELLKRAETNPSLQRRVKEAMNHAFSGAQALTFARPASQSSRSNPIMKAFGTAVNGFHTLPGFTKFIASSLIGTPFVRGMVNNFQLLWETSPLTSNKLIGPKRVKDAPRYSELTQKHPSAFKEGEAALLRDMERGGVYSPEFSRGMRWSGPLLGALALGYYSSLSDEDFDNLSHEQVKMATYPGGWKEAKSLRGPLGILSLYALTAHYIEAKRRGSHKYDTPEGKVMLQDVADLLTPSGKKGASVAEAAKMAGEGATDVGAWQKWADSLAAQYGEGFAKMGWMGDVVNEVGDTIRGTDEGRAEKRPEIPQRGETPVFDAFVRGATSRYGKKSDERSLQAYDPFSGREKYEREAGRNYLPFSGKSRAVGPLEQFVEAHQGMISPKEVLLAHIGDKAFNADMFDYFTSALDEPREALGGSSFSEWMLYGKEIDGEAVSEEQKVEYVRKEMADIKREAVNAAMNKAIEEERPLPETKELQELRKMKSEERLRGLQRLPALEGSRFSKGRRNLMRETIIPAPPAQ